MKRPLITLTLILISCYSFAQSITGDWYGALSVNGTNIPLVFHIAKSGDAYTTTFDSPDQGARMGWQRIRLLLRVTNWLSKLQPIKLNTQAHLRPIVTR